MACYFIRQIADGSLSLFALRYLSYCILTCHPVRGIRKATESEHKHYSGFCAGCVLPVNNGTEVSGDSIVVDFESSHFLGTMLLRIKDTPQLELSSYQDKSYFDGKKRRFQGKVVL